MQNEVTSPSALLLIDADPRIRAAITALLKVALPDLTVAEASNAGEALECMRMTSFAVILVDAVQTSPEPPSSLIEYLRMMTGSIIIALGTRNQHRSVADKAGAHGFISKAASADVLLPAVKWAFGNGNQPQPATHFH